MFFIWDIWYIFSFISCKLQMLIMMAYWILYENLSFRILSGKDYKNRKLSALKNKNSFLFFYNKVRVTCKYISTQSKTKIKACIYVHHATKSSKSISIFKTFNNSITNTRHFINIGLLTSVCISMIGVIGRLQKWNMFETFESH